MRFSLACDPSTLKIVEMVCNLEYFRAVLVGSNCTIPGCFYCSEFLNLFLYNNAMIELKIPGRGKFELEYLVCDVNGTLAVDGQLQDGVIRGLTNLKDRLSIHLLTADTFGRQAVIDRQLNLEAVRIEPGEEAAQKTAFVRQLGPEKVVAIGQGANDAGMIKEARLGICIISPEGSAVETLLAADMVVPDIMSALDLLEKPLRVVAGLRK
jgi:soluble P-type ATPase